MAQPPSSPPSSDIGGVDRDEKKIIARGKAPDPQQQEKLEAVRPKSAARPPYDPDMEREGNPQ